MRKFLLILATLAVITASVKSVPSVHFYPESTLRNADQDYLLDGIASVGLSGSPGFLAIYENNSFPIIAGRQGNANPTRHPVGVGGRLGTGRLVGFAHDNFMTPEDGDSPGQPTDKNNFIMNVIRWLAGGVSPERAAIIPTSFDAENDTLIQLLESNGVVVTVILVEDLPNVSQLEQFDIVCVKEFFDLDSVPALKQYVNNGGGLAIALTSWAYYYFTKVNGDFASNWGPNIISKDFGFVWRNEEGDSIGSGTGPDGSFNASQSYLVDTTFPESWSQVKSALKNGASNSTDLLQFSSVFEAGVQAIPLDATFFKDPQVYRDALNYTSSDGQPSPSQESPVTDIMDKFKLQVYQGLSAAVLTPDDILAHPSSSLFPGNVSATSKNQQQHFVKISLTTPTWFSSREKHDTKTRRYVTKFKNQCDGQVNRSPSYEEHNRMPREEELEVPFPVWYSTGLYAPAGSNVEATIVSGPGSDSPFLTLQIGTHTDDISVQRDWFRPPRIVSRTYFTNGTALLSSPYGGSVFIVSSEGLGPVNQTIELSFTGTVKSPYFKLGETTARQWRETIRYEPGAWTEFVTDKVVISSPSAFIRDLEDPETLLTFWDEVMDAIADLAAIPRERHHPERLVPDIQISAGFMHSGYPIMTFLNEGKIPLNLTLLRTEGSWGHFHELGHNHQQDAWTFSGTGEVTCNLFALYVMNNVCGIPREQTRFEMTPESYRPEINDYIASNLDFNLWKSRPFMALMFYVQLQETYGWTAFKKAFQSYHLLSDEDYPDSDQAKMDLWLIKFSEAVGENLYDYFLSWGIPITSAISDQLTQYPPANISMQDLL